MRSDALATMLRSARRWSSSPARVATLSFIVASLCLGAVVGWTAGSDRDLSEESSFAGSSPGPTKGPAELVMPDLRGLSLTASRQVLADIGVRPGSITVTSQPAAGETGVVLEQQPVSGYDASGRITLRISSAATVPGIAGRPGTAVLSELEQLGAQVASEPRYVPQVAAGQIASILPRPGSTLPERVRVVIATAPTRLDLSTLDAVDYGCGSAEDLGLNGTAYATGLTCSAYDEPTTQTYVVNRGGARVTGVLGVPDDENATGAVHLTIRADGRVVGDYDARYGSTKAFSADVTGALRISFQVTGRGGEDVSAGLGGLTLIGDPTILDPLVSDD